MCNNSNKILYRKKRNKWRKKKSHIHTPHTELTNTTIFIYTCIECVCVSVPFLVCLFVCPIFIFFSFFTLLFPFITKTILARNTVHRSAYNKLLFENYMRILSSDAPTYIGSSPSPLIMSNQLDFITDRRCRSKSPPPRLPSSLTLGKLDYFYNGAAAHHHSQYTKKMRNRCDQMST